MAASTAIPIRICCDGRDPTVGINHKLKASEPTIEPAVLMAQTRPAALAGSSPGAVTEAKANGKLAPHNSVAGKIAQVARTRSSSKLNHGSSDSQGSTG